MLGKKRIHLNADHSKLNKFWGEKDNNFQLFLPVLKDVVSNAVNYRYSIVLRLTGMRKLTSIRSTRVKDRINVNVLLGANVPSNRVSHFIRRPNIIKEIKEWLLSEDERQTVILLGMGGAGKTQLALECCEIAKAEPSFAAVLWIDASSSATVTQSYSDIALGVTGGLQAIIDVKESLAIIERALHQRKGRWLAVFDNFDNPKDFQAIRHYVPKATGGKVLFTSRHAHSERLGDVIRVSGMSQDESLDLLLRRPTSDATERLQAIAVAEMMGYLALALDQAGAYIRARSNLPLHKFISHYKERKQKILEEVPEVWEYRRKLGETEKETALSIFVTWELSFAQLSGNTEAKDRKEHFLMLAGHFDNKCISQRYFEAYCRAAHIQWTQMFMTDGEWKDYEYEDLVAEYRKLSLVQTLDQPADRVQFSLHPMIGDWLKVRKQREEQGLYSREFTSLLTCYIEGVMFNTLDLKVKQETLLHIDACVQSDRETVGELCGSTMKCRSYSASLFASCYRFDGQYNVAEELYKRALTGNEEKLGPKHPDTLRTV